MPDHDEQGERRNADYVAELEQERDAWRALAALRTRQRDTQSEKKQRLYGELLSVLSDVEVALDHVVLTGTPIPDNAVERLRAVKDRRHNDGSVE